MSKIFTLDEANTLLPVLSVFLQKARDAALQAGRLEDEMASLSQRIYLSGGLHVDVPAAARRRAEREKALEEARTNIGEIEEIGAVVVEDATSQLEIRCAAAGRTILLCWTLGESEIERWREDEDGSEPQSLASGPFGRGPSRVQ